MKHIRNNFIALLALAIALLSLSIVFMQNSQLTYSTNQSVDSTKYNVGDKESTDVSPRGTTLDSTEPSPVNNNSAAQVDTNISNEKDSSEQESLIEVGTINNPNEEDFWQRIGPEDNWQAPEDD